MNIVYEYNEQDDRVAVEYVLQYRKEYTNGNKKDLLKFLAKKGVCPEHSRPIIDKAFCLYRLLQGDL